jgi:hypothetical protein
MNFPIVTEYLTIKLKSKAKIRDDCFAHGKPELECTWQKYYTMNSEMELIMIITIIKPGLMMSLPFYLFEDYSKFHYSV